VVPRLPLLATKVVAGKLLVSGSELSTSSVGAGLKKDQLSHVAAIEGKRADLLTVH